MSVPTNWDSAGQGIQDEIDAVSAKVNPVASAASNVLTFSTSSLPGKFGRLVIQVTRSGGGTPQKAKIAGNDFITFSLADGGTAYITIEFVLADLLRVLSAANFGSAIAADVAYSSSTSITFDSNLVVNRCDLYAV